MRSTTLLLACALSACPDTLPTQAPDTPASADLPLSDGPVFPDAVADLGADAADATSPAPGEVIVTEIMKDTTIVGDDAGEWFELHNLTDRDLSLEGCTLTSDGDPDHLIDSPLTLTARGYAVIARSGDADLNGGLAGVAYVQQDVELSNGADTLGIRCDGERVDEVAWDDSGAWPTAVGAALSLSPEAHSAADNDAAESWCDAVAVYGAGDRGTPGQGNPSCDTADPCTPNPCLSPPPAECAGDLLTTYAPLGTCASVAGAATCDYPPTVTDCAAEFGGTCAAGVCTDAPDMPASAGEVLVTEIMKDTAAVADDSGEWFELHNPTGAPLLLSGCALLSLGDDPHTVGAGVTIAPGAYLVFGRESDDALNGGVGLDYAYGGDVKLANTLDDIELRCGGASIDKVAYNDAGQWPDSQGKALSLDPGSYDAMANNSPGAWCDAPTVFGSGDYGTPGAANPDCPDPCTGVTCSNPPPPTCVDGDVLTFSPSGVCSAGSCTYAVSDTEPCGALLCQDGACVNPVDVAPPPAPGELVISEVMQNPSAVGDAVGEWFEVTSTASNDVELAGCRIISGAAEHVIAADGSLLVTAGEVAVFADNGTSATNGGVEAAYAYDGVTLSNGSDDLSIACGASVIDAVAWDDGATFPDPNGASMHLDGDSVDATSNDAGSNWCAGFASFGDGDLGSPGVLNGPCPGPCDSLPCDTPPAPECVGNVATTYVASGTCSDGTCSYPVEDSEDCGADICLGATCAPGGPPHPAPGEVIVTEFLGDPDAVADGDGEWVELLNVSAATVTLEGCLIRDDGSNSHTISAPLVVDAGALVVLGKNATPGANGGVSVTYAYGGQFSLSNSTPDDIVLECGGSVIDAVSFGAGWPGGQGVAAQLDPSSQTASANDLPANWCAAPAAWAGGDLGSPGTANPACGGVTDPCDGVDCDPGESCVDGSCVPDNPGTHPGVGDVIFSEIFYDATGADDGKEWVELYNITAATFDLDGCSFNDAAGGTTIASGGALTIGPGQYVVLAESANSASNGGVSGVDYAYGATPSLNNDTDTLTLVCGGQTVDTVVYGPGFPDPVGASIELDAGNLSGLANDSGASWCEADASDLLGGGDAGTPGQANGTCGGAGPPPPGAGDVIVTEIMFDYADGAISADADREWFEVLNVGGATFDLNGCAITDNEDVVTVANGAPLLIAPGARVVFGQSASTAINGGVAVDYAYGTSALTLGNSGDQIIISCAGASIDQVDYAQSGFSTPSGASLALDPASEGAGANDSGANWCASTTAYGDGALGTPGGPNPSCGGATTCDDPPPPTCNSGSVDTYQAVGTWMGDGCTYAVESSTACTGGDVCEAGGCIDPAASTVLSALTWGEPGDLVINEIMFNPSVIDDTAGEWFEVINYSLDDLDFSGCEIKSSGDAIHTIAPTGSLVVPALEFAVFGVNRDVYSNGGAPVDYEYSGITLTNSSGDDLTLECDGVVLDTVDYSAGFPLPNGASLQYDDVVMQSAASKAAAATQNDDAANWCATGSATTYGLDGNAGTPRDYNAACP